MPSAQKWLLVCLMMVLVMNILVLVIGVWLGHEGMFNFGAEVGKVVFGTVVGSLSSAITGSSKSHRSSE